VNVFFLTLSERWL